MKNIFSILLISFLFITGCEEKSGQEMREIDINSNAKVTFLEFGSVNCIPCIQMQAVMKSIEQNYGDQVEVIFYDVWKLEGRHYGSQFGIRLIPTQVFLDENGKEFHRHEGFYPESEIDKLLQAKGLAVINTNME